MRSQSKTSRVARFCVRNKVDAKDVEEAEVDPMRPRLRSKGLDLGNWQEQVDVEVGTDADGEDGNYASRPGTPDSGSGPNPAAFTAPNSPLLSVLLYSSRGPSERNPDWDSAFDNNCEPPQAPIADRAQSD